MKQIRRRLTYANVMSSIAVFLILGGATAFAAKQLGKNTVGTKQLKNNAVTNTKIKKNAIVTAKIKNGAVTGPKINLGTLGAVPSATSANDANTVGGNTVKAINFSGNPTTGPTEILNLDGFTLTASCTATPKLSVVANGPAGSRLQSVANPTGITGENKNPVIEDFLHPTSNTELLSEQSDAVIGSTHLYFGSGGRNVTVMWESEAFSGVNPQCAFTGYAIG